MWRLLVVLAGIACAALWLLDVPETVPTDGFVLADGAEIVAGDIMFDYVPEPTIYATDLEIPQFADMHISVGYLPWFDAAARKVLPDPADGTWSLRAVVEGLSARIDELEG